MNADKTKLDWVFGFEMRRGGCILRHDIRDQENRCACPDCEGCEREEMKSRKLWVGIFTAVLLVLVVRNIVIDIRTGTGISGVTWGMGTGVIVGLELLWRKKPN
jgi:hypothetical protein